MQKMAQEWFSQSTEGSEKPSSSLLADWNSYAASQPDENSSLGLGFDLEAAVRSANDTVSGTFSVYREKVKDSRKVQPRLENQLELDIKNGSNSCPPFMVEVDVPRVTDKVSKGVRDLPGNLQSATSSVPSGKALMYFGLLLASGVFFVFLAFTMFLPVMVIMPQKFAICFTLGCAFIIGSFFALKGPKNQFVHMSSKERLPFTLGFLGSMVGTIYVSMVLHSYIFSVFFSVIQVLALAYYAFSYFPGGSAGLKFLSSTLTSTVMRCFGR
ncbi:hypothetical protein TIFTF001_028248 [Ficus carica]|uniref:Vesicle transport protein n=1 Tax=Ficus carica TaxID=3494 RepID=A0AA88IZW7_FICCA|nr:hypothetical protein TIFTF001_028248 [Ficus carica]